MDVKKLNAYLLVVSEYIPQEEIPMLQYRLEKENEDTLAILRALKLKDPTTILIVSLFVGYLGVDRFMIGDFSLGLIKLCTAGFCGIGAFLDFFFIMRATRKNNWKKLNEILDAI